MPLRDGFVVGRVAGCDLVIEDAKASRRHARFVVEGGVVEIEDLASSNGTLLNSKPVTRRVLRSGDCVQIGKTVLTFREGDAPGASAASPKRAAAIEQDNDLFGDTSVGTPAVAPPSRPAPTRPSVVSAPQRPPSARPVPPPSPPKAAAQPPAVVEFADEVVEVRRAEPAPSLATKPSATPAPIVAAGSRVLQFQKKSGGGGLLGDDLSQMSGGTRLLVFAAVLLLAVGIVWGVMTMVG